MIALVAILCEEQARPRSARGRIKAQRDSAVAKAITPPVFVGGGERTHACTKHVRSRVFATRLHTCFPHFQSGPRITCEPTTIEEAGCTGTAAAVAAGCTGLAADAADTADADAAGWTGLAAEPGVACVGRGSGAAFSSRVADPAAARDGEMGMHDVTCCLASWMKALSFCITDKLRARRATVKLAAGFLTLIREQTPEPALDLKQSC